MTHNKHHHYDHLENMTRARRWIFTLNNYTEEEEKHLQGLVEEQYLKYLLYGKEVAPSTGTPHLQGFLILASAKTLQQVKDKLFPRIHLEISKGNFQQIFDYCTKEGNVTELGNKPNQGSRSDLQRFREMVDNGATETNVAQELFDTWAKYPNLYGRYRRLQIRDNVPRYNLDSFNWDPIPLDSSIIIWGDAGIGKTEFAKALLGRYFLISHLDELPGYNPVDYEGIIFDDMSFTHLHREAQIHLLDWDNDRAIHIRYGIATIPAETKKIFTTNVNGGNIFNLDDAAIKRRVKVHHLVNL